MNKFTSILALLLALSFSNSVFAGDIPNKSCFFVKDENNTSACFAHSFKVAHKAALKLEWMLGFDDDDNVWIALKQNSSRKECHNAASILGWSDFCELSSLNLFRK